MTVGMSLAQAADGKSQGYTALTEAQPTDSGKKVEVTEFFWYGCPHCFAFDPFLTDWVKKQGDKIVFKRVPVFFRDNFLPQQKAYYALEALGKADQVHPKLFDAIHKDHQRLETEEALTDFVVKQGVDKAKFLDAYNSFSVQAKVTRATKLQTTYRINGVPTIAIGGKFVTGPSDVAQTLNSNASE
ncbi:MAG: thiol:disulfide interchange protein DsbA/DsbL, partial [Burkholderiales bacterium]|nr:thiol:disulfide interchange protein DsbA/DsbL [Burkholderiales bacterium]